MTCVLIKYEQVTTVVKSSAYKPQVKLTYNVQGVKLTFQKYLFELFVIYTCHVLVVKLTFALYRHVHKLRTKSFEKAFVLENDFSRSSYSFLFNDLSL